MSLRYLFGPTTAGFADEHLATPRRRGECVTFGHPGDGADIEFGPGDRWADARSRLPVGWEPDLVAVWLAYTAVPDALWAAPVPLVGLAADWSLLWHGYRRLLPLCEAVLTDTAGVEVMHRAGIRTARYACLYGPGRSWLGLAGDPAGDPPRDIDVLFVGNLNPAVQRERMPWLARLARLADRHTVRIVTGATGPAYRVLLRRAKLAFNRSARGEANQRLFEAAAAGAVPLVEAGNRENGRFFAPGVEAVEYADDLEEAVERVLGDPALQHRVAGAARDRVRGYGFDILLARGLAEAAGVCGLRERAAARAERAAGPDPVARTWARLAAGRRAGRRAAPADPDAASLLGDRGTGRSVTARLSAVLADPSPCPVLARSRRRNHWRHHPRSIRGGLAARRWSPGPGRRLRHRLDLPRGRTGSGMSGWSGSGPPGCTRLIRRPKPRPSGRSCGGGCTCCSAG
ncbi:MAG: glycosyltransferase [Gemmataceae bacterium]